LTVQRSARYGAITLHSMLSYMASGTSNKVCQFVEVGGFFPGILLASQELRWMMSETVFRDVAVFHRLYLVAKPSHVGFDVDELACILHHSSVYDRKMRGQYFLSGVVLSHRAIVGSGIFLRVHSPWIWIFDGVLVVRVPV
jgi:hypothetical protein